MLSLSYDPLFHLLATFFGGTGVGSSFEEPPMKKKEKVDHESKNNDKLTDAHKKPNAPKESNESNEDVPA